MRNLSLAVAVVMILGCGSFVSGQTVSGTLVESGTDRPVMLGRMLLLDTAYAVIDQTLTDEKGQFTLNALEPGSYWVVADRMGYWPAADGLIEFGPGGYLPVRFYLRPRPVPLEGLTITAERRRIERRLNLAGFYDRQAEGFGHFISPDEIEEWPPADVPELLRRVPGVRFDHQGASGDVLYFQARGAGSTSADDLVPDGYCRPNVFLNGSRIDNEPRRQMGEVAEGRGRQARDRRPGVEIPINEIVNIYDIVAVEVYRGASTPLQWGGSNGNCGTVLFWTGG